MTEKVTGSDWRFREKLEKILSSNIKEIPWEGTDINKQGIISGIISLIESKEYSLLHHKKPNYVKKI